MNIDIPVAIAKALLYPGLVSLLVIVVVLFLAGERLAAIVSGRKKGLVSWVDLLSWGMAWARIRAGGERAVCFVSLVLLSVIVASLPTYSGVSLVEQDLNYALLVFLLTAYPLARYFLALRRGGAASPLILFYGLLLQLSLLGVGLVGQGWELSRLSGLGGQALRELPGAFLAAVFSIAMLYLLCRASSLGQAFYRFLDLLFLLAGAALIEVAFLGLSPGLYGFLGLAGCFLLLRLAAELIIRYHLTRRPLFYARLTAFVIVIGLLARELLT